MATSREIRLKSRPSGTPTPDNFELASVELGAPGAGEVQVRNHYMSVDPYMRGRMVDRASYVPPFELGKALQGGAIGEVVASNDPGFQVGDTVQSMFGWREAYNAPAAMLQKTDLHGMPEQAFLGVVGMPGLTAYAGLLHVAEMKEGDVVFVSGAAGAVGAVVCQVAKLKGASMVIGSAGGPEKAAFLKEIGVDHVIDYKAVGDSAEALTEALAKAAPKGVDVYFDNVGGAHLEAALNAARPFARFAMCGGISQYNTEEPVGPRNIMLTVGKQLTLKGFIVSTYAHLQQQFVQDMAGWIGSGKLTWRETVDQGVESAPGAFIKLFTGGNTGKMLVKL